MREVPDPGMRRVGVVLLILLLSAHVDSASAQVPARVAPPYTLMDAEHRMHIALRAQCEAMELEASLKEWTPEQRQLVFRNTVGGVTRYGAFYELVSPPLFRATGLPYRKPHAMRHSYATWLLEAGADIRWVKDQMGHASIGETEGTYGHLVRERHERDVDHLDAVLGAVNLVGDGGGALESDHCGRSAASPGVAPATDRSLSADQRDGELMVKGKGFVPHYPLSANT